MQYESNDCEMFFRVFLNTLDVEGFAELWTPGEYVDTCTAWSHCRSKAYLS